MSSYLRTTLTFRLMQRPVFYGGVLDYTIPAEVGSETPIWSPSPDNHLLGTHFVALSKEMIQLAVPYLNSIMSRPEGSPDGGPMHVDGAYSWLRRAYPEKRTWIAAPVLGHQRSSRTDVHELGLLDTIPVLRDAVAIARRAKRYLMRA
jgi:glycosyl transferase family 25